MMNSPVTTVLGKDPDRKHRINANSFQQNAITTCHGWQYIAYYTDGKNPGVCVVNIARRKVLEAGGLSQDLETLRLDDYKQVVDDGHNTISIGLCEGDGTIHVAFDHHCDQLRFRISEIGLAFDCNSSWEPSNFSPTQHHLPGVSSKLVLDEITYPRFINIGGDLLLTYRVGQAGLGSDVLYRYSSASHKYTYIGQHLTGVSNSPYINGMSYHLGRLHISWCYRNFIPVEPNTVTDAHKQQAGPNGPENNFDLNYAYSDDLGYSWNNSEGVTIANMREPNGETIRPDTKGIVVFEIPMRSGILNQEAQAVDYEGGVWVLNRENRTGTQSWVLYHRSPHGNWTKQEIENAAPPTETGARGSICVDKKNIIYLILPGNTDCSLSILTSNGRKGTKFREVWSGKGYDGEPLVDLQGLESSQRLSIFTRTKIDVNLQRYIVVLDFELPQQVDD